jgi:hypothetical protein
MSGPWEEYQTKSGPWDNYKKTPTAADIPGADGLPVPARAEAPEASMGEKLARQLGLTVRAGVSGITALPTMAADVPFLLARMGGADVPLPSEAQQRLMNRAGLPEPANATERVAQDVASGMAGAGGFNALGGLLQKTTAPAAQAIGDMLRAGPAMQTAGAASGSAASGITRENGGGAGAQLAAGLAGSIAPSLAVAGSAAATKASIRGGEAGRQKLVDRIQAFEDVGATPSVGQATGNRAMQAIESGLSKTPGSAGRMIAKGEEQAADIGVGVNALANELTPNATATKAGAKIEKGLQGFMERFKGEQEFLYNKLDKFIPKTERVDVSETKNALAKLNVDIPGAPETSRFFKNSRIQNIEGALKSDTESAAGAFSQLGPIQRQLIKDLPESQQTAIAAGMIDGKLPFEALQKLRTLVGREISDSNLASDVPRSKWKALYGALSADMESAAKQAGPDAEKALSRANAYTSAGHNRIESVLDRVAGKDTVEKVFQAATNPSELREGASTINAVMRSLVPEERKIVTSAFLKRMGIANPGNQNDLGELFSSQTFLTNWNKLSQEAKMAMFGGTHSPELLKDLSRVAQVSDIIKQGSKVFANPSGTSQAAANIGTTTGLGAAIGTGHLGVAGLILGGIASANLTARMMTNPDVVRWLSTNTHISPSMLPSALNQLSQISSKNPALKQDIDAYIKAVKQAPAKDISAGQ